MPLQVSELSPRPPLTRRPLDAFHHRPHHASRITHRVSRQLFSFFNAGDMDGVRRMVAGHFSDDCLLRTVVMDKVLRPYLGPYLRPYLRPYLGPYLLPAAHRRHGMLFAGMLRWSPLFLLLTVNALFSPSLIAVVVLPSPPLLVTMTAAYRSSRCAGGSTCWRCSKACT